MQVEDFRLKRPDGAYIRAYRWLPPNAPRAVVLIAHGLSEHAGRYARFAAALCEAGFTVYAHDHRGHGQSVSPTSPLGHVADRDGWNLMLDDMQAMLAHAKSQHSDSPQFLLGHSMGSFLTQCFIARHGSGLKGAVISASSGKPPALALAGRLIARIEQLRLGPKGQSDLLLNLSFGAFNKRFEPARTAYDWLSRDPVEVDRYVADPLCGGKASCATWIALLDGIAEAARPEVQAHIPKALPILAITGTDDPVSAGGRGVRQLLETYGAIGLGKARGIFYDGARHELLNETNRDQVTADVVAFFDACLKA